MKAITYHRYGGPYALAVAAIDPPALRADSVRVRVCAVSVNPYDWHFMRGQPYFMRLMSGLRRPRRMQLGLDFAGRVAEVGRDVIGFQPGDEVYGMSDGAFAEYVCPKASELAIKPKNLSFEEAAAVPLAGSTALQGLRDAGQLSAGERVLIIGASGGIGSFAVQLAKLFGAHVTGVWGTANLAFVHALGADEVLDYTRGDFLDGPGRYDVILQLGGMHSALELRRALSPRRRVVLSSGDSENRWIGPIGRLLEAALARPFVDHALADLNTRCRQEDLQYLARVIEDGGLAIHVARTYSFEELPEAMRELETGHPRGKIVVSV